MSTHTEQSPLIVCVPNFFADILPGPVPEEVRFFQPGMPREAYSQTSQPLYTPDALPMSTKEAALWLRELLSFGAEHERDLQRTVLRDDFVPERTGPGELSPDESRDLKAFAATGQVPAEKNKPAGPSPQKLALLRAQKLLLMGCSLENDIRQARSLIAATEKTHERLLENLGVQDIPFSLGNTDDIPRPEWSEIFSAMLLFTPPDACFYAENGEIEAMLRDDGEPLPDLSPEETRRLFPLSSGRNWRFAAGKIKRGPFSGQDGEILVIMPTRTGA